MNPGLIPPALWHNGPESGTNNDIPGDDALIHLLPQPENQVIVVLQPRSSVTPPATTASELTDLIVENPENNDVVILDAANQPIRDWASVLDGTYTVIVGNYNRVTRIQTLNVDKQGLKTLKVPKLAIQSSLKATGRLILPQASEYIFLIFTASGGLVTDLSTLAPGYYDIFSYKLGEAGPLASLQLIQAGQLSNLRFNSAFESSSSSTFAPSSSTYSSPAIPSTSSGGQCYVSGYTRKDGIRVSGYYCRC